MALTAYSLPDISALAGTFKVKIYSSQAGLTVPTVDTVLEIGEREETVDSALGLIQVSRLQMRVRDDYSTHAEGFWYKLFSTGDAYIRILLSEGGSDKFFFVGPVQEDATVWTEAYISGSDRLRTAEFTVLSMAAVLFDATVSDWQTEIVLHEATASPTSSGLWPNKVVSLKGVFASLLKSSGLNASYNTADVSFVFDASNPDIKWQFSAVDYTLNDLFIATEYYDGGGTGDTSYFTGSTEFKDIFAKAGEMLAALLMNIGCVLRMDYDATTETASALGTHKLQIVQRGRAYSTTISFSTAEKSSSIRKASEFVGDAVATRAAWDGAIDSYGSRKFKSTVGSGTPPNYVDFDIDFLYLFNARNEAPYTGGANTTVDRVFWVNTGSDQGGSNYATPGIISYNYESASYGTIGTGDDNIDGLVEYYFYRFTANYSKIVRSYGVIQSTVSGGGSTSFTNTHVLRRQSINDGTGASNYYANRVVLRPMTLETEVEWIKE